MSGLYDGGREGILNDEIELSRANVMVMLVKAGYGFSASHKFVSDLAASDNGRSGPLTGKTFSFGAFGASPITLKALSASVCVGLVLFASTGNDRTSRLIAFINTPAIGLPFTSQDGQEVRIEWDQSTNKIFRI